MQHHPQTYEPQNMASHPHASMGHRGHAHGHLTKLRRLPRGAILSWCDGKRIVSRCGVLSVYVVSEDGNPFSRCPVLFGGFVCGCLWWDIRVWNWVHEGCGGFEWMEMDLHTGKLPPLSVSLPNPSPTAQPAVFSAHQICQCHSANKEQEGLLTVVVALISYLFIHNYPEAAPFLTADERAFIHARLKGDNDATNHETFEWFNVVAALKDYKCWLYGLGFHTLSLPLYTLSLFLPSIIAALGYTAAHAQLLTVPPYAIATLLTIIVAILAEKTQRRAPFVIACSSLAIIGYIILLTTPAKRPGISYLGTIFAASGIYPSTAIVLSWPAANVSDRLNAQQQLP